MDKKSSDNLIAEMLAVLKEVYALTGDCEECVNNISYQFVEDIINKVEQEATQEITFIESKDFPFYYEGTVGSFVLGVDRDSRMQWSWAINIDDHTVEYGNSESMDDAIKEVINRYNSLISNHPIVKLSKLIKETK